MSDERYESENGRSWAWPDGPFGCPAYGHDCYLTYLLNYLAPKVTQCPATQDDLKQEIVMHLLRNTKHYREHANMQPHSFVALQVRQAISRFKEDKRYESLQELGDVAAIITEANKSSNWRS